MRKISEYNDLWQNLNVVFEKNLRVNGKKIYIECSLEIFEKFRPRDLVYLHQTEYRILNQIWDVMNISQ